MIQIKRLQENRWIIPIPDLAIPSGVLVCRAVNQTDKTVKTFAVIASGLLTDSHDLRFTEVGSGADGSLGQVTFTKAGQYTFRLNVAASYTTDSAAMTEIYVEPAQVP